MADSPFWKPHTTERLYRILPQSGQLWEWVAGAFHGTHFLVMEVIPSVHDPERLSWTNVDIQEFIDGGLKPRQVTLDAILGNGRPL